MGNNSSKGRKDQNHVQGHNQVPSNPQYQPQAPIYPTEPPPPYTPTPIPAHAYPNNYSMPTTTPLYPGQQMVPQQYPPANQVVVAAEYDPGARFDNIARPNIPPPPPGVFPNAAQLAAAQGHTVVMNKPKTGFLGDKGAGYTFW